MEKTEGGVLYEGGQGSSPCSDWDTALQVSGAKSAPGQRKQRVKKEPGGQVSKNVVRSRVCKKENVRGGGGRGRAAQCWWRWEGPDKDLAVSSGKEGKSLG